MDASLKKRFTKGFTLIELLVVIAIIGILGAIVYAPFQTARRKGRDAQRVVEMKNLYSTIMLYADSHNGEFPPNLAALRANQSDGLPTNTNYDSSPNLTKYNYTSYNNGTVKEDGTYKIIGFHLYTHLETRNPVLDGSARCFGVNIGPTSCINSIAGSAVDGRGTTEAADGAEAFFTNRDYDTDNICASDITKCIYDLRQ